MHRASQEERSGFASSCLYGFKIPWTKKLTAFPVPDTEVVVLSISSTSYSEMPFFDIAQAGKVFAKQSWIPLSVPSASSTVNEAIQLLRTDSNAFADFGFLLRFRRAELDEHCQLPEAQGLYQKRNHEILG